PAPSTTPARRSAVLHRRSGRVRARGALGRRPYRVDRAPARPSASPDHAGRGRAIRGRSSCLPGYEFYRNIYLKGRNTRLGLLYRPDSWRASPAQPLQSEPGMTSTTSIIQQPGAPIAPPTTRTVSLAVGRRIVNDDVIGRPQVGDPFLAGETAYAHTK